MKNKFLLIAIILLVILGVNFYTPAEAQVYVPTKTEYMWGWQDVGVGRLQDVLIDTWKVRDNIAIIGYDIHEEVGFLDLPTSLSGGDVRIAAFLSDNEDPQNYNERFAIINVALATHPTGISGLPIDDVAISGLWLEFDDGDEIYLRETVDNRVSGSRVTTRPRVIIYYVER